MILLYKGKIHVDNTTTKKLCKLGYYNDGTVMKVTMPFIRLGNRKELNIKARQCQSHISFET